MFAVRRLGLAALTLALLLTWNAGPLALAFHPVAAKSLTAGNLRLYVRGLSTNRLQPLDAATLLGSPAVAGFTVGPANMPPPELFTTPQGTAFASVAYAFGSPGPKEQTTIRLFSSRGQRMSGAYHPAVALEVQGLSPDGKQLYGSGYRPPSLSSGGSPPATGFYVLNAANGRVLYHLPPSEDCCGPTLYDARSGRLYVLDEATSSESAAPATPVLKAYDVHSGRLLGSLPLTGVRAGAWMQPTSPNGSLVRVAWTPGFALRPDGRQIAVLDGSSDTLMTIDTSTLQAENRAVLSRPQSLLEQVGSFLGLMPSIAEAKELTGAALTMMYSPDGASLLVSGYAGDAPDAQGFYTPQVLPLRRVDVATGQLAAETPSPVVAAYWQYAPDGSAFYTYGPATWSDYSSPWVLRRFDPATLSVLASRDLDSHLSATPFVVMMR